MALHALRTIVMKPTSTDDTTIAAPTFIAPTAGELAAMAIVRDHVAKGALSMIDWANHKPANAGKKPKVGGHQASSMSSVDLLCALYLHAKRPQDRVAVKPHAAPIIYALMHLMGRLTSSEMNELREFKGPQPYPTKLKNPDFVDYTTSSEALGVCAAIYDAYGAKLHNRSLRHVHEKPPVDSVYWAHCGDGELTEGQIDESLYDAGRWGLDNLVWIVDLNRQSLDRVMDDSLGGRLETWAGAKFRAQSWEVIDLRWGARALALFSRPGGDALQGLLEEMSDALFHPLMCVGGDIARLILAGERHSADPATKQLLAHYGRRLTVDETTQQGLAKLLETVDDATLAAGLSHLGGHDMGALLSAYETATAIEGAPAVIIAHTVKGYETSAAGHPENHGGLLPREEVVAWGLDRGLPKDTPYPSPETGSPAASLLAQRRGLLFEDVDHSYAAPPTDQMAPALAAIKAPRRSVVSSGEVFQSLNLAVLRNESVAPWVHFGAPDVGQTTHLGPVIKSTGVFSPRDGVQDTFEWLRTDRKLAFDWRPSATGQFHALGIAEGNAMLWAYAFGRRKKRVEGKAPLVTVVTVYDKFFERGFNQLDYAAYSDARFVAVGTPSGTGLSRETATHQSIQTPRMVMDLPGIIAYEPAFAVDVWAVYRWALGQLWADDGEAVYLRLTTQPLEQPNVLPEDVEARAIAGAYWLVGADDRWNTGEEAANVVLIGSGRKLAQLRVAAERLDTEHGVGSRILNVTSYEALWRDWDAYNNDPEAWDDPKRTYYLHELFTETAVNASLIITGDHVASVCEWLPGALQRLRGYRFLGPRRNGEAGSLEAIDALHGMGVDDIIQAAVADVRWRKKAGLL